MSEQLWIVNVQDQEYMARDIEMVDPREEEYGARAMFQAPGAVIRDIRLTGVVWPIGLREVVLEVPAGVRFSVVRASQRPDPK